MTEFHTTNGVQKQMDSMPGFMKKSAKRVAKEAIADTFKGKSLSIPTKTYKLFVLILKVTPKFLFPLLFKTLASTKNSN